MKKILLLFVFVFLSTACAKEEIKTSYLQQFVKEDTTILDSFEYPNNEKITKEKILIELDLCMGFLEKEYEIKKPENPEPNQVYEVTSKDEEQNLFKVYHINNMGIVTADRTFIDKTITLAEQKDVYAGIRYGIYVGQYDIGKQSIQETDTKYINKAETYLQSIFPYLNFDDYILKVTHGDAGQTSFNYYADKTPKENQARDFGWISPLLDSHIDITISRNLLDKFLYNE